MREFHFEGGKSQFFYHSIAVHESKYEWPALIQLVPQFPRGWFELSKLSGDDRIGFTREYWLSQISFTQTQGDLELRLNDFFESLEEIGIYAVQVTKQAPYEIHMVYSLKDEMGFFQGSPPATESTLELLGRQFGSILFPPDYLAFLKIHDGFSKYTDTGMIRSRDMGQVYQRLQHLLAEEILVRPDGQVIEPESLIPFYESFGLHSYQCFYCDWHPGLYMGNVYFSELERSISNYQNSHSLEENLAFSTFVDWLIFYLEDILHL